VRDLSRGLTRGRELAGERYLSDPDLLGAYLLHFWPVSFVQVSLCLEMIGRLPGAGEIVTALDLGAGPGAASLALLEAGIRRVSACDRSGAALALARKIAQGRGHDLDTRQWDALKSTGQPTGRFDLVVVAHTLNELWAGHPDRIALRVDLLQRIGALLSPGGRLLVVEPALMKVAQDAIRVRDGLAGAGWDVLLPCIWQGNCPALPQGTCHGEFDWDPPREMVRLSHAARIGRETLKMAWFVLRKKEGTPRDPAAVEPAPGVPLQTEAASSTAPAPRASPQAHSATPDGGLYRVVSEPLLSKSGRIRYLVCGPLGRFALSAPKECPAPRVKPFYMLKRGEGIRFTGAQERESGWGLDAGSAVSVEQRVPRG
jgi:SAM-dependent methyltransferase